MPATEGEEEDNEERINEKQESETATINFVFSLSHTPTRSLIKHGHGAN